jgi:hypothetical protein
MPHILDNVRVGDSLKITVNGVRKLEPVKRVAGLVVETQHHRFTRFGRTWPEVKLSIVAELASKDEVQHWFAEGGNG